MNYLFLMTLLIFSSSCTNYGPFGDNDSEEESETYYLELDFHQLALENEDHQLSAELLAIEEQLENGNDENQARMEEIQIRRAIIEENLANNADFLNFRPGIPGGGLPPSCEPQLEFRPCPMPFVALDNLWIFTKNEKVSIQVQDLKGNVVGEMVGMEVVPETDGLFAKAIMEYNFEDASKVVITKSNTRGVRIAIGYDLY